MFGASMGILSILFVLLSVSARYTSSVNEEKLTNTELSGFRANLIHIDSLLSPYGPGNISFPDRLQRAVRRSKHRLQKLQRIPGQSSDRNLQKTTEIGAPVNTGSGEFLMKLAIGTPALPYSAILDTGSDLTWTQCKPCTDCYKQSTPIYDPSRSSTYSKVPCKSLLCNALPEFECKNTAGCEYQYTYGDFSITVGILSSETLTLTSKSGTQQLIPNFAFGCGQNNEGNGFDQGAGIVGLGRGPLSLISQLSASMPKKFSYCLMKIDDSQSKTSPLMFGESARLSGKVSSSTPIVQNSQESTFYYLLLDGISVGGKLLNIKKDTFILQSDGSGGFVIDSGTTVTYLEQAGYDAVKQELSSLIKLPVADGSQIGLDLCYKPPASRGSLPRFPIITFHFRGADYHLPRENYMVFDKSGLLCLGMLPNSGMSIFGNVQQQNYHILYDMENKLLSFEPAICDTL